MWVGMCRPLIRGWPIINNIWKEKKRHKSAIELVTLLIESDLSWRECAEGDPKDDETISLGLGPGKGGHNTKEGREGDETKADEMTPRSLNPETPLILAASTGIEEIFDEITNRFPQAVDYVTEDGWNVLHLAIMFRQEKIFKRIKKMEMSLPKLASRIDNYGNTILHYVADMTYYPGGTRPGPALQFQEELEWYQRVENLVPSHYAMHRNKKEKTAKELFTGTHEDLHKKAQEWMKDTSQSCSTVAILVATVVFAAAYTVPGGVNSENGLPILLDSPLFKLFAVMDVVSLGSSLTSVVMFLSILTSPFQQDNFLDSLPRKLTIGFTFLFLSVLTTMITFTASILLTVRLGKRWTSTLIYSASFIPVMIFALIMFPWYAAFVGTSIKLIVKIKKALPERKKTN